MTSSVRKGRSCSSWHLLCCDGTDFLYLIQLLQMRYTHESSQACVYLHTFVVDSMCLGCARVKVMCQETAAFWVSTFIFWS